MSIRHETEDCPFLNDRTRWTRLTRERPHCYHYDDICHKGSIRIGFGLGIGAICFVFLILVGIFGGVGIARHYSHEACGNYGAQTKREVKWVDASYFDYGCYVKWNGRWVERDSFMRLTFGQETGGEP